MRLKLYFRIKFILDNLNLLFNSNIIIILISFK